MDTKDIKTCTTQSLKRRLTFLNKRLSECEIVEHWYTKKLTKEKENIVRELGLRSIKGSSNDREKLTELQCELKNIQKEIKQLTTHKNGEPYWEVLRTIIEEYIYDKNDSIRSYEMYSLYKKLHKDITGKVGIKTRTITESEFKQALFIIESDWNYKVPDEYK